MTKQNIEAAFLAAQPEFTSARKSGENKHLKSTYSTLKDVQDAIYPALHRHGIMVVFGIVWHEQQPIGVECRFVMDDQSMSTICPAVFSGNAQQRGSEITYAKRYALIALSGVAINDGTDDDGEAAKQGPNSGPGPTRPTKPTVKQMMSDIARAPDEDRLAQIEAFVQANANTSKDVLVKAIEEKRLSWTDPGATDPYADE